MTGFTSDHYLKSTGLSSGTLLAWQSFIYTGISAAATMVLAWLYHEFLASRLAR